MFLLMKECVIVSLGVMLCCSCSLAAVLHVFLLMNVAERVCNCLFRFHSMLFVLVRSSRVTCVFLS